MIFIYASSPVKKIVACFRPGEIVKGHPDYLWEQFWDVSGIEEDAFFEYFEGKENGFAIKIDKLEQFGTPIDPREIFDRFVAPQSFCYVDYPENQAMIRFNRQKMKNIIEE